MALIPEWKKYTCLLIIMILSAISPLYATHIVGGEMNYRYLGNDNYEINLTVYRDCFNGIPPFDDPAGVYFFSTNTNALLDSLMIQRGAIDSIPLEINSTCVQPPANICYETTTYTDTINLPPVPGGYTIAYQRCCRNGTIINIINPGDAGATYMATIPDSSVGINSNPVFNKLPPPFICANAPFTFDHSATDAEGDSLVYKLCTPLTGGSTANPIPQPASAPPYSNISWQPPYSLSNLLGGAPLAINAQTGELTAMPNTTGQFVYGICVEEYRNGMLISQTQRDFQANVTDCPGIIVASAQSPLISCGDNTVSFKNNSVGADRFFWNFGDPTTSEDTSTQIEPTYTYPDTGSYQILLVAISDLDTNCRDSSYTTIGLFPDLMIDFSYQRSLCEFEAYFTDQSISQSTITSRQWDFGDSTTSSEENPVHLYDTAGIYTITLIVESIEGCIDSMQQIIDLTLPVSLNAGEDTLVCSKGGGIQIGPEPNANFIYSWDPGIGLNDSTLANPIANPPFPVTYVLRASNGRCMKTDTITVAIITEIPDAAFDYTLSYDCAGISYDFKNLSIDTDTLFWNFNGQTSTLPNPEFFIANAGEQEVELIATNSNGCADTVTVVIKAKELQEQFKNNIPNVFTPNNDGSNECFNISYLAPAKECFSINIYNRWGEHVFESNDPEQCWQGIIQSNGKAAPEGTYYYILKIRNVALTGYVEVIR